MKFRGFSLPTATGIHYTVRIFIGTLIVWSLTQAIHAATPIWAVVSLIIVTEPQMHMAWLAFRSRMLNTLVGATVGFGAQLFAGPTPLAMTSAIALSALISTCVNRFQLGWRIAPITSALVISATMTQRSGLEAALSRTFDVFLGSAVAVAVSLVMERLWLPPAKAGEAQKR